MNDAEIQDGRNGAEPLSRMLLAHVENALNADENECEHTDANARPPRTQGAVELQDRDDGAVDQDAKRVPITEPIPPDSDVPPITTEAMASNSMPVANWP